MTHEERTQNIVAYVRTIIDSIEGMDEDEVRELIKEDCKLMDEDAARFTLEHLDEIVAVALDEI